MSNFCGRLDKDPLFRTSTSVYINPSSDEDESINLINGVEVREHQESSEEERHGNKTIRSERSFSQNTDSSVQEQQCKESANGGQTLTCSGQISANGGQKSANSGQMSTNGGQTLANGGQMSINGGQMSAYGGHESALARQMSSIRIQESPKDESADKPQEEENEDGIEKLIKEVDREGLKEGCMQKTKSFISGFHLNPSVWMEKGVIVKIGLFLFFNIILLTLDVLFDILTCHQFIMDGYIHWGMINLCMIFCPFVLRLIFGFVNELKYVDSSKYPTLCLKSTGIMFSFNRIKKIFLSAFECFPLYQTFHNVQKWQKMKYQALFSNNNKILFGIQTTTIMNSMIETFAEGAPCQIINLYIFMMTGYMTITQIISVCLGIFSLSWTGVKIFLLYRAEDEIEVDPGMRLTFLILPWMIINTAASILLWTYLAAYTKGYIVIVILVVFLMNWISITCAKKTKHQPQLNDQLSDKKVYNFSFSDVETAMISTLLPCVVGTNRSVFMSQLLATNISKICILCFIWFRWDTLSLNTPLVTCVNMNASELYCAEPNVTNSKDEYQCCTSIQSCFCGYNCDESQIGQKIRLCDDENTDVWVQYIPCAVSFSLSILSSLVLFYFSDYTNILEFTRVINRKLKTKIIFHSTLIKQALTGGEMIYENFSNSEDGKKLILLNNHKKVLKILLSDEQTMGDITEDQKRTRNTLFSLDPQNIAAEFVNKADKFGKYPIVSAAENKDVKLVKTLFDCGKMLFLRNADGCGVIQEGIPFFSDLLKMLVKKELKQSWSSETIENPSYNELQTKVAEYKPSEKDKNLKEIIKLIKKDKTQLALKNKDGKNVLIIAAEKGHLHLMKALIKLGAGEGIDEMDSNGFSALMIACYHGNVEIVKILTNLRAEMNCANRSLHTPLMLACSFQRGHEEIVQLLINNGKSMEQADKDVWTQILLAGQDGYAKIVQILIDGGANMEQTDKDGRTALMIACQAGHTSIVKKLIQNGANLEKTDKDSWTALMLTCKEGHADIVGELVVKGAKLTPAINTPLMLDGQGNKDVPS